MKQYQRHVIVCDGSDCCKDGGGADLLKEVRQQLGRQSKDVKCSKVSCLGQCKQGPVLIVYPDGVWYRCMDKNALRRIVKKHLLGGKIARDHVLFRMSRS